MMLDENRSQCTNNVYSIYRIYFGCICLLKYNRTKKGDSFCDFVLKTSNVCYAHQNW